MRVFCHKKTEHVFEDDWESWCYEYQAYQPIYYEFRKMKPQDKMATCCCRRE